MAHYSSSRADGYFRNPEPSYCSPGLSYDEDRKLNHDGYRMASDGYQRRFDERHPKHHSSHGNRDNGKVSASGGDSVAEIGIGIAIVSIIITSGFASTGLALAAATARLGAMVALYTGGAAATAVVTAGTGYATIEGTRYAVKKVRPGVFAVIREVHRAADVIEARGAAATRATTNAAVRTGESTANVVRGAAQSGTEALESVQQHVSAASRPARSFLSSAFSLNTLNPFRRFSGDFSDALPPGPDAEDEGFVDVSHAAPAMDAHEQEPEAVSGETEYYDIRNLTDDELARIVGDDTTERIIFINEEQLAALSQTHDDSNNLSDVTGGSGENQEIFQEINMVDNESGEDWETIDTMEGAISPINPKTTQPAGPNLAAGPAEQEALTIQR